MLKLCSSETRICTEEQSHKIRLQIYCCNILLYNIGNKDLWYTFWFVIITCQACYMINDVCFRKTYKQHGVHVGMYKTLEGTSPQWFHKHQEVGPDQAEHQHQHIELFFLWGAHGAWTGHRRQHQERALIGQRPKVQVKDNQRGRLDKSKLTVYHVIQLMGVSLFL